MGVVSKKTAQAEEAAVLDPSYTGPNWHQCEAKGCPCEGHFYGPSGMVCLFHANVPVNMWPSITEIVVKTEQLRALADLWTVASLQENPDMGDDRVDLWAICDQFNEEAESLINRNLREANKKIQERNELRAARPDGGAPEKPWPLIPHVPHTEYGPGFYMHSPPYILSAWTTTMAEMMTDKKSKTAGSKKMRVRYDVNEILSRIRAKAKAFYRTPPDDLQQIGEF